MPKKVFCEQISVLALVVSMTVRISANEKWNNKSFCPEAPCVCWNPETADCAYRNLTSISFQLPSNINTLILTGNNFSRVLDDMFFRLINLNITRLSMDKCHVNFISPRAFEHLEHLIFLDLSYNNLTFHDLETAMRFLEKSHLQILNISRNALYLWPGLLIDLFNCVWLKELREVVMTGGNVQMPEFKSFSRLKKLENLDLRNNKIFYITPYNLSNLQNLNLADNDIQNLPFFRFPKLKLLNMTRNKLSKTYGLRAFVSLPELAFLDLSHNPIIRIQSLSFERLKSLKSLRIDHLQGTLVDGFAFESDSLQKLSVGNIQYFNTDIFSNCIKLQSLTILNTDFSEINITDYLLPLTNLTTLQISSSGIKYVPPLQNFSRLQNLDLSQNNIKNIQSSVLDNLRSIQSIVLHHNFFSTIDYVSFPPFVWKNESISLDLSSNPFDCGCQLIWFVEWLNNNQKRAKNYPNMYKCNSPSDKRGILLADLDTSECHRPNQYLILSFTICGCISLICFTAIILRKLRWDIKYYIHVCKNKKSSGYKRILDDEFLYDGFVAYNTNDRKWIMSELVENLEKKYSFKLCLHERDIIPGGIFVDDIHHNIEASRKFILVLSNNFLSDQWCRYETTIANHTVVDGRSEKVLIVLLGEISSQYMTNSLKTLIKSTVNLEWTERENGKKLFWKNLQTEMQK